MYWGKGYVQYLLPVACVYLLVRRKKIRQAGLFLGYFALGLFFYWCPLTAGIIQKCVGTDVYWRYLWVLPTVPVLALAMTDFCMNCKKKLLRFAAVVLMAGVIVVSGEAIRPSEIYSKESNRQKVPETVAAVCSIIREDAKDGEVLLATDDDLASFIRVYDASIQMPYGRAARGASNSIERQLYQLIMQTPMDCEALMDCVGQTDVNYLVVKLAKETEEEANICIESHDFMRIGKVNDYGIYRAEPSKLKIE
jgi:hypothetical protein